MTIRQLPLIKDLDLKKQDYLLQDYFISESNSVLYNLLINKQPVYPCLIVLGGQKSGKTHIAKIWSQKFNACYFKKTSTLDKILNKNCVFDDIDKITKKNELEDLLHCYNSTIEHKRFLLMTAKELNFASCLADLHSRLLATPSLHIMPPDDELLRVIIRKIFYTKQIRVEEVIVNFILQKVERSIKSVTEFIDLVSLESTKNKEKISIKFLKKIAEAI